MGAVGRHVRVHAVSASHNLNQAFAYAPFKGGAGPTQEQSQACNNALVAALVAEGLPVRWQHDEALDEQVVAVGDKAASYDRWGFCSADGALDNVDLALTVAYFKGQL